MRLVSPTNLSQRKEGRRFWLFGPLAVLTALLVIAALMRVTSSVDPLEDAQTAMKHPVTISIIGDSTGNDLNEWIALWAADLGTDREVSLHRWLDGRYAPDPVRYGNRGDPITIWNASQPGGAANWATDQLGSIQPEPPDLVILNLGHNNTEGNIAPELEELRLRLSNSEPMVLVLQNPGRGAHRGTQAATLQSAARWAESHQVPTIDVTAAFTDPEGQMLDDAHPNEAGSRIWADSVAKALSP